MKCDLVLAHGLLHHLTDEESSILIELAYYYLKPGGLFYTHDSVNYEEQSRLKRYFTNKDRGQNIRTPEKYLSLVKDQFEVLSSEILENEIIIPHFS